MNTGDRCPLCGTILGAGGNKPGSGKKHGWNVPRGGTVACHEATPDQLVARREAVVEAEARVTKAIDRTVH